MMIFRKGKTLKEMYLKKFSFSLPKIFNTVSPLTKNAPTLRTSEMDFTINNETVQYIEDVMEKWCDNYNVHFESEFRSTLLEFRNKIEDMSIDIQRLQIK